jgi:hypothetical protein
LAAAAAAEVHTYFVLIDDIFLTDFNRAKLDIRYCTQMWRESKNYELEM